MMRDFFFSYTMERPHGVSINLIVYQLLLLTCWVFALWRGGAPERIGATILVIASYLTLAALSPQAIFFQSLERGVLIVDLVCALAFVALALHAERYWPLWVAGLQILGASMHLVRIIDTEIAAGAYAFLLAVWAYPMILLMIVGTVRHRRRLARLGIDHDWSLANVAASSSHWHTKRWTLPHLR